MPPVNGGVKLKRRIVHPRFSGRRENPSNLTPITVFCCGTQKRTVSPPMTAQKECQQFVTDRKPAKFNINYNNNSLQTNIFFTEQNFTRNNFQIDVRTRNGTNALNFTCRLRRVDNGITYALYPQSVNITEAHAKCARKGGELAEIPTTGHPTAAFLTSLLMSYRSESYGGTGYALLAYTRISGDNNCMILTDVSSLVNSNCFVRGVPICKMNTV